MSELIRPARLATVTLDAVDTSRAPPGNGAIDTERLVGDLPSVMQPVKSVALDGRALQQFRCRIAIHLMRPALGSVPLLPVPKDPPHPPHKKTQTTRRHRLEDPPGGPKSTSSGTSRAWHAYRSARLSSAAATLVKRALARPALGRSRNRRAASGDGVASGQDDVQRTGQ